MNAKLTTIVERPDLAEYFTYEILRNNPHLQRGDNMKHQIALARDGKVFKTKKAKDDEDEDGERPIGMFYQNMEIVINPAEEDEAPSKPIPSDARTVVAKQMTMYLLADKKSTNIATHLKIKGGKFLHPHRCTTEVTIDPVKNNPVCAIAYSFGVANE